MKPRRQEDSFSSSTAPCYNLIEKHHITAQPSPPPDYKCTLYRAVLKNKLILLHTDVIAMPLFLLGDNIVIEII